MIAAVDADTPWYPENPDGSISIMNAERKPEFAWIVFSKHCYRKEAPVSDGQTTYRFTETIMIDRCADILNARDRRCGHEAIQGQK